MLSKGIYLDYNATAPIHPELKAQLPLWLEVWGNPSSIHGHGRDAKKLLREARASFAKLIGCHPLEVLFTSGGSEANNLALKGAPVERIIVSAIEHPSVLEAAKASGKTVQVVPVTMQGELDLVWKHLLPAMQDKPLAADEAPHAKLRQTLSSLALHPPKVQPASPTAGRISGKTFKLDANGLGMDSVSFHLDEKSCVFTAQAKDAKHSIAHGIESWQHGATQMPGTPPRYITGNHPEKNYKVAASATWSDEHTLELTWRYIETPHHDSVTCRFDGDQIAVTFLSSIAKLNGKQNETRPRLQGRFAG